ncbi:MAG: hypothetical protein IKF46_07490 [Erysipelotrichaceae bacterium]|nr:hypothetical protein [Erysipelotrichaceae bacterium]
MVDYDIWKGILNVRKENDGKYVYALSKLDPVEKNSALGTDILSRLAEVNQQRAVNKSKPRKKRSVKRDSLVLESKTAQPALLQETNPMQDDMFYDRRKTSAHQTKMRHLFCDNCLIRFRFVNDKVYFFI